MEVQINFITKKDIFSRNFTCPNCLTENPFATTKIAFKEVEALSGYKSKCVNCLESFLALDDECVPASMHSELNKIGPMMVYADIEALDAEAMLEIKRGRSNFL